MDDPPWYAPPDVHEHEGGLLAPVGVVCNHHYMSTNDKEREATVAERLRGWFTGRVPAEWLDGAIDVRVDREEITVILPIPSPQVADGATEAERSAAWDGRSRRFREDTRQQRIEIAHEAEHSFGRKVSWGVRNKDDSTVMYTTFSVPVMTRLRQAERLVLDTLVDAGVARSRSDALAWCVRLVGKHEDAWLADLRTALQHVEQVRDAGPRSQAS
jgi:hypothetical protein